MPLRVKQLRPETGPSKQITYKSKSFTYTCEHQCVLVAIEIVAHGLVKLYEI